MAEVDESNPRQTLTNEDKQTMQAIKKQCLNIAKALSSGGFADSAAVFTRRAKYIDEWTEEKYNNAEPDDRYVFDRFLSKYESITQYSEDDLDKIKVVAAVATQGETVDLTSNLKEDINKTFDKMLTLHDNDDMQKRITEYKAKKQATNLVKELNTTEETYSQGITAFNKEYAPIIEKHLNKLSLSDQQLMRQYLTNMQQLEKSSSQLLQDMQLVSDPLLNKNINQKEFNNFNNSLAKNCDNSAKLASSYDKIFELTAKLQQDKNFKAEIDDKSAALKKPQASGEKKYPALDSAVDIGAIQILPVQRIPRYKMLLEDLVKQVNRSDLKQSASEPLTETLNMVKNKASLLNDGMKVTSMVTAYTGLTANFKKPHSSFQNTAIKILEIAKALDKHYSNKENNNNKSDVEKTDPKALTEALEKINKDLQVQLLVDKSLANTYKNDLAQKKAELTKLNSDMIKNPLRIFNKQDQGKLQTLKSDINNLNKQITVRTAAIEETNKLLTVAMPKEKGKKQEPPIVLSQMVQISKNMLEPSANNEKILNKAETVNHYNQKKSPPQLPERKSLAKLSEDFAKLTDAGKSMTDTSHGKQTQGLYQISIKRSDEREKDTNSKVKEVEAKKEDKIKDHEKEHSTPKKPGM